MEIKTRQRFAAAAAVSALAGSAVVPVAAASLEFTEKFSDVPLSSSHYEAILEAQSLKMMTGYGDLTFKPDQKLNRGNVVKAFGKYIVAKSGMTLEEYVEEHQISEVENFTDVPDDWADEELVTYSKIVKGAGIFKGSDNKLEASKLMPRDQIAEVLVRAFGFEDQEGDPGITDIGKSGYAKSIEIIYENGISNVRLYRPLESTSRGQFASFLVRAYKVSEELDPQSPYPYPVESVHELENITITVGEIPKLPETVGVTLESGVVTKKAVEWNTNNLSTDEVGTYTVMGEVADTNLMASIEVIVKKPTYTDPATVSISNNIIVVASNFNESALDPSNYKFNNGPLPLGTTIEGNDMGVTITIPMPQEDIPEDLGYTLEITQNVKTSDGHIIVNNPNGANNGTEMPENFTISGKFYDNVPPTLISAHYVIPSADSKATDIIQLTFSEAMSSVYIDLTPYEEPGFEYMWEEFYYQNLDFHKHLVDDLIFRIDGTEVYTYTGINNYVVDDEKVYIKIPSMDIKQDSTITIVPEGETNEKLMITDGSWGRNPVVAPVTKTITKDDVVIIEPGESTK